MFIFYRCGVVGGDLIIGSLVFGFYGFIGGVFAVKTTVIWILYHGLKILRRILLLQLFISIRVILCLNFVAI